jgi:MRG-binding protein
MIPQDDQPMMDATPTTETPATTPAVPTLQADPWTDEQEISLFKGVVNWKPAGQ